MKIKKFNAFTLIELLAVIAVLAIITLIITPIINGILDDAKRKSFETSNYAIISTAETGFTQTKLNNGFATATKFVYVDGVENKSAGNIELSYEGQKPKNGTLVINDQGKVALAFYQKGYCATKGFEDVDIIVEHRSEGDCKISETVLTTVAISGGTLNPTFASDKFAYNVTTTVDNFTVTPTAASDSSTITVNGATVKSGKASSPIALDIGINAPISIVVRTDINTYTYTIVVTRINPYLSSISVNSGALDPIFSGNQLNYNVLTPNPTITVTPTSAAGGSSTITVNGIPAVSEQQTAPLPLVIGSNNIVIVYTTSISTTTYHLNVTRINPCLSNLVIKKGLTVLTLSPPFETEILSYTLTLPAATSIITVTPTLQDNVNNTVVVNGTVVGSGTPKSISLPIGMTQVLIVVRNSSTNDVLRTYTVDVTRIS